MVFPTQLCKKIIAFLFIFQLLIPRLLVFAVYPKEEFIGFRHEKSLQFRFLDVGQGDGILVKFPNGKSMLVDAGPIEASEVVLNGIVLMGIKKIDVVVSTHPDIDHIGGLLDVLRLFPVKKVYDSGKGYDTLTYLEYIRLVHERHIPFSTVKERAKIVIDPDVSITVLNSGEGKSVNNEASIVLLISYKNMDFLLAADADKVIEKKMVKKYGMDAEVLKVGHHGSKSSSSMKFLKAVNPTYAVISYENKNPFHHPHGTVVRKLKKMNINVYTTAKYGDIEMKTDGYRLWIDHEEVRDHLNR